MSMPTFPNICPPIKREDALNMILTSISMEEASLSHLINAEGEKLQYVLGTLPGCDKKKATTEATTEEILAINASIKSLLDSINQCQMLLKSKMESALEAMDHHSGPVGPAGPPGPPGPRGPSGHTCAIALAGKSNYYWEAGKRMQWDRPRCTECRSISLSSDRKEIILESCRCYTVCFSVDFCSACREDRCAEILLQTSSSDKKTDRYTCHVPIVRHDTPFSASACGILISTRETLHPTMLMLTLSAPSEIKVRQSALSVTEI